MVVLVRKGCGGGWGEESKVVVVVVGAELSWRLRRGENITLYQIIWGNGEVSKKKKRNT